MEDRINPDLSFQRFRSENVTKNKKLECVSDFRNNDIELAFLDDFCRKQSRRGDA